MNKLKPLYTVPNKYGFKRWKTFCDVEAIIRKIELRQTIELPNQELLQLSGNRLLTYTKGIACVWCKKVKVDFFAIETQKDRTSFHINAYGYTDQGEVLFTSDHIVPVSRGGAGHITNRQPMCAPCNHKKSNNIILGEGGIII